MAQITESMQDQRRRRSGAGWLTLLEEKVRWEPSLRAFYPVAEATLDTQLLDGILRTVGISIFTRRGYSHAVEAVRFSTDGKWLASVDIDGTAIVWSAQTGDLLYELTR